jgi:phosphomannomutase
VLPENRELIIDKVRETGADLGIAWDGDADRCFFIDDTGEFVAGDFRTALLAESVLRKEPGATILYDVRASRAVRDVVERAGGRAEVNRVGHAFFKTRMRDTGAAFGGEVSGHYYFRDFYCGLGHDPGASHPGACLDRGSQAERTARASALALLHLK